MKRTVVALLVAAVAALALGPSAVPALGESSPHKTAYQAGPYSMADSGTTDFWTCTGFRLDAGSTVQDHFRCTIADQTFSGMFTPNKPWPCGCTGWLSDYDGQLASKYSISVSRNGTVTGSATYQR